VAHGLRLAEARQADGRIAHQAGKALVGVGVFIIVDGGGTGYTSLGALPDLAGKFAYVCWGEKGTNKADTRYLPSALKAEGATVVGSEMAGVGHAFAETEKPKIAVWLEKVALAAPAKK
jgi:hypothetical protein